MFAKFTTTALLLLEIVSFPMSVEIPIKHEAFNGKNHGEHMGTRTSLVTMEVFMQKVDEIGRSPGVNDSENPSGFWLRVF